ncbi:MAG: DUF1934 domain-containing protein [Clostridia bacterium]|nr:DUF1934 domain-containing protein [Clostridia bacterium]
MLKKVAISMSVERQGVAGELFEEWMDVMESGALLASLTEPALDEDGNPDEVQESEMFCNGRLRLTDDEFSLTYEETELTGMEGTQSQLSFRFAERGLVTMLRTGAVKTALVFEKGKRHLCVYQTPYMPFEVCVYTLKVDNRLMMGGDRADGVLELDYIVEIHGARAERCRMRLEIKEME